MSKHNKTNLPETAPRAIAGVTLVELLVALAIGSFLIIGAVQVANQSRQAFRINESVAKVQETAQFAIDTIEADLRMASNWGLTSRGDAVEGRAIDAGLPGGDADPFDLLPAAAEACGAAWALDLVRPIQGDNSYTLPCGATGTAQANSDIVTIRRATAEPVALQLGRVQIQTTRTQGQLFNDNAVPAGFDPATSETHNLLVNTYYVAQSSTLIPGVPTLRRKALTVNAGNPTIEDQEVAPGVENMQLQFGVDVDQDNAIDRYVNPGDGILVPGDAAFVPGARVMTARIWLVIRSIDLEMGVEQQAGGYAPGNVVLNPADDNYRRLLVSKTVLLRNSRT
jgi:type IV pilus assembly protein PilW